MLLFTSQFDLLLPLPISFELKYEKARFSNDPISFLFKGDWKVAEFRFLFRFVFIFTSRMLFKLKVHFPLHN